MAVELVLTKANRLRLARAFRRNKRVDISIDCVIEGQMGEAFVDDPENPTAFRIATGPLWYLAGKAASPAGYDMMRSLPPYTLLMPSPPEWIEIAREIHGSTLLPFDRYSFSSAHLSIEHLSGLLDRSPFKDAIQPIDALLAQQFLNEPDGPVDLSAFDSANDFVERGIGFCLIADNRVCGAAYSSLVCSKGIEVSIFVAPEYRTRGAATALASRLLQCCLENNLDPHWDAANPESCKLAMKLGYTHTETYEAYFLKE